MTNSQTLEQFLRVWNENAYLTICESADMENVIKALGKQIPKKPTYVGTRFRNHGKNIADGASLSKCYQCPNCKLHIFHVFDNEVYCKHCGQDLDWSKD